MKTSEDILAHYGKQGMKWGVRKGNTPKMSNDAKRASYATKKMKKGGVKALSNNEIRDLQKRLDLEKRLKDVTPGTKSQAVANIIANTSSSVLKGAVTSVASQQVGDMLKKAIVKK